MQTYNVINNELTGAELPGKIYENMQSLKSDFSGTSFPTENLVAGMSCFRTDQNKIYKLLSDLATWRLVSDLNVEGGVAIATQAEAEGGSNNTKVMTPLRVKQFGNKSYLSKSGGELKGSLSISSPYAMLTLNETQSNTNVSIFKNASNSLDAGLVIEDNSVNGTTQLLVQDSSVLEDKLRIKNNDTTYRIFGTHNRATQAQVEAGTDNNTVMTPLRTAQEIEAKSLVYVGRSTAITNIDKPEVNGFFEYRSTEVDYTGTLPFNGFAPFLNLVDKTKFSCLQITGSQSHGYFIRGTQNSTGSLANTPWKKLATTDDFAPVIWQRNNYYRGKSLGTSLTTVQSDAIRNGTFDDIYVGDYWTIGGVVYRIVAIDYYYNCGDTACTTHHVVVVPDTILYSAQMNTSNVVTGGYVGSAMYTSNLANAKTTILNAFGSGHILTIRQYFSNASSSYVTGGTWADANVWLMNEINVYGCSVFANLIHGTNWVAAYTIDNCQYPAFRANPRLIHTRQTYWLRDVAGSPAFAGVSSDGYVHYYGASHSTGVRPAFCVY